MKIFHKVKEFKQVQMEVGFTEVVLKKELEKEREY